MALPLIHFTVTLKTVLIFLHLVGAVTWIGALALYVLVVRRTPSPGDILGASRKAVRTSKRLDYIVWGGLLVLLITGAWNTLDNPVSKTMTGRILGSFEELELLGDTAFGSALRIKHGFFLLLIVLMAYRSFKLLPELARLVEEGNTEKSQAVMGDLERANNFILLLGYVILMFSAIIVFSLR